MRYKKDQFIMSTENPKRLHTLREGRSMPHIAQEMMELAENGNHVVDRAALREEAADAARHLMPHIKTNILLIGAHQRKIRDPDDFDPQLDMPDIGEEVLDLAAEAMYRELGYGQDQ